MILSGDTLRGELFGDERLQYTNAFLIEHGYDAENMTHREKEIAGQTLVWNMLKDRAIQLLKEAAGSDVSGRMMPVLRNIPLDDEEKHKLTLEIEGASSRMMNRLLFGLRARLSDDTLRECLNTMKDIMCAVTRRQNGDQYE